MHNISNLFLLFIICLYVLFINAFPFIYYIMYNLFEKYDLIVSFELLLGKVLSRIEHISTSSHNFLLNTFGRIRMTKTCSIIFIYFKVF